MSRSLVWGVALAGVILTSIRGVRQDMARLESRQGVHVKRDRVADDLVEKILPELDLAVPQRARVWLALAPPKLRGTGNRRVEIQIQRPETRLVGRGRHARAPLHRAC